MCYPCTHCNKCGRGTVKGICLACGHANPPAATACEACGARFPLPPGVTRSGTAARSAAETLEDGVGSKE